MIRLRGSRRVTLIAVLAAALTLVGGGGAVAYWSVTAQLEAAAVTATIGLTQTVHPDAASTPLNVTYSAANLTAAGAVTVVNTGSREADYRIALTTQSQTAAGLPAAISAAVAPVADAASCTPTTMLSAPQTGTLSSTGAFSAGGEVAAGATLVLCVQTSLSATGATTHQNASTVLALQTQLEYAPLAAWTLTGTSVVFTQSVGSSLLFFTDDSARYRVFHDGRCVEKHDPDLLGRSTGSACNRDIGEWRISPVGDGTFTVGRARNGAALAVQWTAVAPAAGATTRLAAAAPQSDQRWRISSVSEMGYRFESVKHPGTCLTLGEGLWHGPNLGGARKIVLATCDGGAAQEFTFEQLGDPLGEPEIMSCQGGGGSYLGLEYARDELYYQETVHRVFFAHADTASTRVPFASAVNPGSPQVHLNTSESTLRSAVNAVGAGNIWVYVQAQIAGGSWNDAGVGKFRAAINGSTVTLSCGWS